MVTRPFGGKGDRIEILRDLDDRRGMRKGTMYTVVADNDHGTVEVVSPNGDRVELFPDEYRVIQ